MGDLKDVHKGIKTNTMGLAARNLTTVQFITAFKNIFAVRYFGSSEGTNYIDDINEVLLNLTPACFEDYAEILSESRCVYILLKVFAGDCTNLKCPEGTAVLYITGYILKNCLMQHTCDTCINFYNDSDSFINEELLFCKLKAYNETKYSFGGLTIRLRHCKLYFRARKYFY
nr:unnamed protein product [Callosobruchus analis]